jgi:hypothetical protein
MDWLNPSYHWVKPMGKGHFQSVMPTLTSYCPHLRAHGLGNPPTMGFIIRLRVSFGLGCCWHMRSYYVDLLYCLEKGRWHLINGYTWWLSLKKVIGKACQMSCFMNNHFSIGKLHNSFGNFLFICFRNFRNTFDENWMMKNWMKNLCSH